MMYLTRVKLLSKSARATRNNKKNLHIDARCKGRTINFLEGGGEKY